MKFVFEAEDCIIGIIVGLVMVGLSGRYYKLPDYAILWGILFTISLIFTVLDVIHTLKDLGGHLVMLFVLFINNAIDFIIETALAAKYFNLTLPFFSMLNPYLAQPNILFVVGVFFIVSSVFWLIAFPFVS